MTAVQTRPATHELLRLAERSLDPVRPHEIDLRTPELFETVEYINAAMRAQRLPADV